MEKVEIDCQDKDWKSFLMLNLQRGNGIDLAHFDCTLDGEFCEMLALSHFYDFKLDAEAEAAFFKMKKSN